MAFGWGSIFQLIADMVGKVSPALQATEGLGSMAGLAETGGQIGRLASSLKPVSDIANTAGGVIGKLSDLFSGDQKSSGGSGGGGELIGARTTGTTGGGQQTPGISLTPGDVRSRLTSLKSEGAAAGLSGMSESGYMETLQDQLAAMGLDQAKINELMASLQGV